MTVSVIVPNYNHAPYLRQRIDSILNQSFQDFELILIDDASTDGSQAILESYRTNPKVSHLIFGETNSGSAFRQWDKGIELATGKWIWIAESDDYAEQTFLECMIEEVDKVPRCCLAYAATWWVDEKGNKLWDTPISHDTIVYEGYDFIRRKLAISNSIANVSECIFLRECYRPSESHRYEHMRLCGDWLFYVLLAEQGQVVELKNPLSYYRQHSTNISSTAEHDGLTFLEGIDVLDYITTYCGIRRKYYSRGWGRMWAHYEKQYQFTSEIRKKVWIRISKRHPDITLNYLKYKLVHLFKPAKRPAPIESTHNKQ